MFCPMWDMEQTVIVPFWVSGLSKEKVTKLQHAMWFLGWLYSN